LGEFADLIERGLVQMLREDHPNSQIIGTGLNRAELIKVTARESPQVVALYETAVAATTILDLLKAVQPATAVLVLAHEPTDVYGTISLAAGTTCVASSASADDILAAIHFTAQGGRMFVPSAGKRIERHAPQNPLLTAREVDVLELLSRDESYAAVAYALKISVETARSHAASIRTKLGVAHKQELVGIPVPPRPKRSG
jgi:DNA-binding NarL/FixJ family response regulator